MNMFEKPKPEESKHEPKDIFELFKSIFGDQIFFMEDILALEGENKTKFIKLLGAKNSTPDNRAISALIATAISNNPGRIKKFSFRLLGPGGGKTAFMVLPSRNPPLTLETARQAYQNRHGSVAVDPSPDSPKKEKRPEVMKLKPEEQAYYEKLKTFGSVTGALKNDGYFNLLHCPASNSRNEIIRKLIKMGLIIVKGKKDKWMTAESLKLGFPEA